MSLQQIIRMIESSPIAKSIFDKAVYWEAEAIKIDYVNKADCIQEDIDSFNTVWANFRHYFDQIGINDAEYEEIKIHFALTN